MSVKSNFVVFLVLSILLISIPLMLENSEHRYVSRVDKKYYSNWVEVNENHRVGGIYPYKKENGKTFVLMNTENIKNIGISYSRVSYNNWVTYLLVFFGVIMFAGDILYLNSKLEISLSGEIKEEN